MNMSPKQTLKELDKYIIGQNKAKKAVAVALRNRYRRSKLDDELKEEVTPKNIIMKGPTGVGKTEIARRLSKLVNAPFVKVEATKFTEVGYVGRDVESMIRELVEVSVRIVKESKLKKVQHKAEEVALTKIFNLIYPLKKDTNSDKPADNQRKQIRKNLDDGKYDEDLVEIEVEESNKGLQMLNDSSSSISIGNIFEGIMPSSALNKKKKKKMSIKNARKNLISQESEKMIDFDNVNEEAIYRAEQEGIIFIDEIDKIAAKNNRGGADVSREGVQRDILPFVEGCTVSTKYGSVKTDHMLFIAAGAFHVSNIEDLIPEFQGRFPIRVELDSLKKKDFVRILQEPKNAIILQYKELLKVDRINLAFTDEAISEIAEISEKENDTSENIGARRLYTIMEEILEDISFRAGDNEDMVDVKITKEYIQKSMSTTIRKHDLNKYVL